MVIFKEVLRGLLPSTRLKSKVFDYVIYLEAHDSTLTIILKAT